MIRVEVDGNIEQSIRRFFRLVEHSGLLIELKKRESFIPWTERRRGAAWKGRQRWLEKFRKMEGR